MFNRKIFFAKYILFALVFFFYPLSFSETSTGYYTISETTPHQNPIARQSFYFIAFNDIEVRIRKIFNLLSLSYHAQPPQPPQFPYNRKQHFGQWINEPNDDTCWNTRTKVLIRNSLQPVTFKANNHCAVESGLWYDPYSNTTITSAQQVQIDHFVPLKNAFMNGADQWDFKTRCLYANFLGNEFQLRAVVSRENLRKGDRDPAHYLPPNSQFVCQYLKDWMEVKLVWRLRLSPIEVNAIAHAMRNYQCTETAFSVKETDLNFQRQFIQNNINYCDHIKRN